MVKLNAPAVAVKFSLPLPHAGVVGSRQQVAVGRRPGEW